MKKGLYNIIQCRYQMLTCMVLSYHLLQLFRWLPCPCSIWRPTQSSLLSPFVTDRSRQRMNMLVSILCKLCLFSSSTTRTSHQVGIKNVRWIFDYLIGWMLDGHLEIPMFSSMTTKCITHHSNYFYGHVFYVPSNHRINYPSNSLSVPLWYHNNVIWHLPGQWLVWMQVKRLSRLNSCQMPRSPVTSVSELLGMCWLPQPLSHAKTPGHCFHLEFSPLWNPIHLLKIKMFCTCFKFLSRSCPVTSW